MTNKTFMTVEEVDDVGVKSPQHQKLQWKWEFPNPMPTKL